MDFVAWLVVAVALVSVRVQAASVEQRLFESFVSNYSKSYWNDPDTKNAKFEVFQVSLQVQLLVAL